MVVFIYIFFESPSLLVFETSIRPALLHIAVKRQTLIILVISEETLQVTDVADESFTITLDNKLRVRAL